MIETQWCDALRNDWGSPGGKEFEVEQSAETPSLLPYRLV
jgi:hypothetical protein